MDKLDQSQKDKQLNLYKNLCLQYTNIWKLFFDKSLSDVQLDKPLSIEILENTTHKITKFLLFLHSQETFLNYDLKIASRQKDE